MNMERKTKRLIMIFLVVLLYFSGFLIIESGVIPHASAAVDERKSVLVLK